MGWEMSVKRLEIGFVMLAAVLVILFANALRVAHDRGIPIWNAQAGSPQGCTGGVPTIYPLRPVPLSKHIA